MNDVVTEVVQDVQNTFGVIIQMGIDFGIPFDLMPETKGEIVYFQGCIQWVIFVVTLVVGGFNNLIRSSIGSLR